MGKPFTIPPWGAVATTGPMIEIDPASDKAGLPPAPYVELLPGREHPPGAPVPPAPPPLKPPAAGDAAPPG